MEQNKFTEKESLELISQMISQSRNNMEVGSGNIMLYYGYPALILSLAVYLLRHLTHNVAWGALWFLMFLPFVLVYLAKRKSPPRAVTHVDKAIGNTWRIIGSLFLLSTIVIVAVSPFTGTCYFVLMLPLSLLYASIGISITGIMADFKLMAYAPLAGFATSNCMLAVLINNGALANWWNLLFGFSFLVMMIIPGHVLNRKIRQETCSKN